MDSTHPGLKEMLKLKGLSVQVQDKYTDIDHLVCLSSNGPVKEEYLRRAHCLCLTEEKNTIRSSLKYV